MSEVTSDFLQWLNSSEAALGVFIAVVGAIASGWFSWHQRNLARRQRAADLFDRFYSPENYHAMVAPVFVVALKWKALRGAERAAYAAVLCKGWPSEDSADKLITAYDPAYADQTGRADPAAFEAEHFSKPRSTEAITEHAALTAFLYFWVKLKAMIDAGLVCKGLIKELFCQPYGIYAQFIANFRQAVIDNPDTADASAAWIKATEALEELLLDRRCEPQRIDWSALSDAPSGGTPSAR